MNRPRTYLLVCYTTVAVTFSACALFAAEQKSADATTYTDHVRPILREYCFSCHNQNKAQNDLKVDSYETLMEGGASGAVIEPGDLESSWLWALITHADEPSMPPNADKMPDDKLAVIKKWIEGGALKEKPAPKTTYTDHVRPILREYCFSCHNQNKAQNDLKVDSYETLMEGGASGAVIEPGDLESSWLWALITHTDEPSMPPNADKMPEDKLAVIKSWIEGGALKDSGSKATVKKQPTMDLSLSAGAGKPEGPAAMPEGLPKVPVVASDRAGASTGIAASPWAPLAAIAGQHQIVLYNTDSAELLGVLPYPEGIPYALRFSRSGSLLLAGGGHAASLGLVVVFDVRTGNRVFQVGDELDAVLAADINENHTRIALGGPEKLVRVFNTADGALAYDINKHTDWILAVEFSPDGVLLATGDRSAGLVVWEADTGREFYLLTDHKGAVTDVSWRSDSNMLASASEDGTIKLWDMNSGKAVRSINAHSGGVAAIDFARDGRLVSCGRDGLVRMWDLSGKNLRDFPRMNDLPLEIAITHDGERVIAGDFSGQTAVWNTSDGKSVGEMPANPQPPKEEAAAAAQDAISKGS